MFKITLTLLAFSVLILTSGVQAADKSTGAINQALQQSCQSDIQKFCSDVTNSDGRVNACLRAHDDKLSDTCNKQWQQAKTEWKAKMKSMHTACSGDVQKFCKNAEGPRDIMSCLDNHQSDLTASCQDFTSKNAMTG